MTDKATEVPAGKPAKPVGQEKKVPADKASFDPNYKPGPDDAQIDAGGARFDTDA